MTSSEYEKKRAACKAEQIHKMTTIFLHKMVLGVKIGIIIRIKPCDIRKMPRKPKKKQFFTKEKERNLLNRK